MKSISGRRYIFGAAVALAVTLLVLAVFSLLSVTDRSDVYLADTQSKRNGWSYEILTDDGVRAYEPAFWDEYTLKLPDEARAVRITRTVAEDIPRAELEWLSYMDGIEVFLDGDLLYTDFPQLPREDDGFVRPDQEQWDRIERAQGGIWRGTRMSMPENFHGRELSVITYFPEDGVRVPEYPFLGGEDSDLAGFIVFSVRYNAIMTVCALLALLMAGVFLVDVHNSNGDGRTLLLCLYFLLLFLNEAYGSDAGVYSVLTERLDLRFLSVVYMAPLYLYLVLRMQSRWKWPLSGAVALWAGYESARELIRLRGPEGTASSIGPAALVILLAVAVGLCADGLRQGGRTRQDKKRFRAYGLTAAGVTAVYMLNRARVWGGLGTYLRDGIWMALSMGNCGPAVGLVTDIVSCVTVIVVVSEVVRRTVRTRRTMDVLRERERQIMAGYERMLASEDDTRALHHEMRHHMIALSAFLADGDIERARRYVDAVADDLGRLPAGRYCQNILVDMIAGSFLDQAAAGGIRVEHHLNVPQSLNIADEDLSVFLSNMLQNALEACRRVEPARERYIWVDMHLRGNFLCIQCVNSAPDGEEPRERPGHGYGLTAMRTIAEKYNSVLLVERTPGEFSVLSDFCLEAI